MTDNDVIDFIEIYNSAEDKPTTAMEWLLFIDKNGFTIHKKEPAQ